ncbi:MAG: metal-dependent transcriptional regulator [Bryobacteraceae bacterium]
MPPRSDGPGNTESVDDYLKAILELSGPEDKLVPGNGLAERLGVRAASVTGMLQKLSASKPPLVKYEKHHGARLTAAGKKRALEILRHHRLLERFLHDSLDYGWDEVHEEAERLEHFISEKLEDRIAAKLGDPQLDPHGHVIPERSGAVSPRQEVNLLNWACGVPAVVSSVYDHNSSELREIDRLGLRPGVSVLVDAGVRNASLLMRIDGQKSPTRLSRHLAARISVVASSPSH